MDRKFHIIFTSEQGQARTFVISKLALKKHLALLGIVFLTILISSATYFSRNVFLPTTLAGSGSDASSLSPGTPNGPGTAGENPGNREAQLSSAYGELNQRSQVIESILATLNVTPPTSSSSQNGKDSGGPFTSLSAANCEELLQKVDQDIKAIRPLPLGYPVKGCEISSPFGAREDPMNGQEAFHEGIDLRGTPGSPVQATADGKVIDQGYNEAYGWFVMISHGNNFTTLYGHNQKLLISRGDSVVRGQNIALLGNSGRSTGPHLHYEIRRNNRPINPSKFMNITKLLS